MQCPSKEEAGRREWGSLSVAPAAALVPEALQLANVVLELLVVVAVELVELRGRGVGGRGAKWLSLSTGVGAESDESFAELLLLVGALEAARESGVGALEEFGAGILGEGGPRAAKGLEGRGGRSGESVVGVDGCLVGSSARSEGAGGSVGRGRVRGLSSLRDGG